MSSLRISLCIVMISLMMLMTTAFVNAQTPKAEVQAVLVFPLDNEAGAENSQAATDITARLADGLGADSGYYSVMYASRLPFVQRLIATNPQKKVSETGPFASNAKALADAYAISESAGVDIAVVGSLNKFGLNDQNIYGANTTIQVLDVKKKEPKETFMISASSDTSAGAIQAMANKLIEQITGKPAVSVPISSPTTPVVQPAFQSGRTTIIVPFAYPVSDDETIANQNKQIAKQLLSALEKEFNSNKMFSVVRYTVQTPALIRAIKEAKIKALDVTSPTDTTIAGAIRAQKIARLIGTNSFILGSIDNSSITADAVNITATIQVVSSKTGKVDNSIVINGSAAKQGSDTQMDLIAKAISDAIAKVTGQLRGPASK
ncbi:MAG: hypothetical protein ACYC0V_15895 [Armatimonadota bacterium]